MSDDLRRKLDAAGRRPVPDPRPEFVSELEDRLVAAARARAPESPPDALPESRRRPRPGFGLAAGLAGLAAVLAIVVVMGGFGLRTTLALELTDAVNVEVALADGTTLVNPEGLLLPDGAIVRIGAGGSARVGDITLGAGDTAVVSGRRLEIDRRDDSTTTVVATPSPSATRVAPSDAPPSRTPSPTDGRPTPAPDRSLPPNATPTPKPASQSPSPVPVDAATPSPTPAAAVMPIKLEARRTGPAEVGVAWTGVPGAARYVLVATASRDGVARDPVYPGAPVIGEFTHPPLKPLSFRVGSDVREVKLLVVALSSDGAVIGRSNIATVELPR